MVSERTKTRHDQVIENVTLDAKEFATVDLKCGHGAMRTVR